MYDPMEAIGRTRDELDRGAGSLREASGSLAPTIANATAVSMSVAIAPPCIMPCSCSSSFLISTLNRARPGSTESISIPKRRGKWLISNFSRIAFSLSGVISILYSFLRGFDLLLGFDAFLCRGDHW